MSVLHGVEYMEGGDLFNALHKHNSSGLTWYRRFATPDLDPSI